jgi:hypothetical protein
MPLRPSAFIEILFNETRAIGAGRKATAESASDAMMIVWNILEQIVCFKIVSIRCNKQLELKSIIFNNYHRES